MGNVLFDKRLGCLNDDLPPRVKEFIDAINSMMYSSLPLIILENLQYKLNTPFWKTHAKAWDKIFEVGKFEGTLVPYLLYIVWVFDLFCCNKLNIFKNL